LEIIVLDLSDFQSVRSAAKLLEDKPINYIFLNAGIVYHVGNSTWLTHGGVDYLMASNFFGHFLLSQLLMPPLIKRRSLCRVIITSSIAHWFGVPDQLFRLNHSLHAAGSDAWQEIYGSSKLANLLHAYELQRRLRADSAAVGVAVVPVTPGLVITDILNAGRDPGAPATHYWCSAANPLAVPAARGAQTSLLAALAPDTPPPLCLCAPYWFPRRLRPWLRPRVALLLEGLQRLTWRPRFATTSPESRDPELARRLWEHAERVVGLA
jgi:NAD(P)-dependent dehydrogenase (short-subunit alcohol dehydrogenase family)